MNYDELMMSALDGTITPPERASLNAYFEQHPDQRAAFEHMLAVDLTFRTVEPPPPPAQFTQRVMVQARLTPVVRPLQRKAVAAVVVGNSVLMALSWVMILALMGVLTWLALQSPVAQPIIAFCRAVTTNLSDAMRAMSSLIRAVFGQPLTWLILVTAFGTVAAWFAVIARVFLPHRSLTFAQR